MASRNAPTVKEVDFADTANALAKAMVEGDIVNFRLLFLPFSPGRESSTETFDMPKYAYLLPDDSSSATEEAMTEEMHFKECLNLVMRPDTREFIEGELAANRPAQLPSELLVMLADNAVRTGKYSSAAQAYEMLRIRERMQQEFFAQADAALDENKVRRAVLGYIIATGLSYDYAAFPEPLPLAPDFQTRALMLHAQYPANPQDAIGMMETKPLLQAALAYLLVEPAAAARLDTRDEEVRVAFVKELVRQRDPRWDEFVRRYHEAVDLAREFGERFQQAQNAAMTLADEIKEQLGDDPRRIPATLLGREIEDGAWWQYLKELAGEHPAAALFVARQQVGEFEILVPRHQPDSPLARALGIL